MKPDVLALWLFAGLAFAAPLAVIEWSVRACVPRLRKQALHSMLLGLASGLLAVLLFAALNHLLAWHANPLHVALGTAFCAGLSVLWMGNAVAAIAQAPD
ncbi:hypothetical protein [Piscinibacter terrae]|uniref:hypothetical protein n=1 Tax=Piscinibacter terrae TaxID=2496871 RepID=UPI000F592BDB|nr:hypothetical protein [Albitalea terrae]